MKSAPPPPPPLIPPAGRTPRWRALARMPGAEGFISWRLYVRNPVCLPGFLPPRRDRAARRVMEVVYAEERARLGHPGLVRRSLMVLGWLAVTAYACPAHFLRHRRAVRRGLPGLRDSTHLRRLLVCAFRHNIAPGEFYQHKLYHDARYARRRHYLLRWHLHTLLRRTLPEDSAAELLDKHHLWQRLTAGGVATVPVLALLRGGAWVEGAWAAAAAAGDLVLKPTRMSRGDGIEFIDAHGSDAWRIGGRRLSGAEVRHHIEARSREFPLILQPRMHNHPQLARYSAEGLATLRIITMKRADMAEPVCLVAALRIPADASRLANLYQHSSVTAVDVGQGVLGPTATARPGCEEVAAHPSTGRPLAGERVPFWPECRELCLAGHRLAPSLNSIGWDVIVTGAGPLVLEANLIWGGHVVQMAGARPLLDTAFAELYAV